MMLNLNSTKYLTSEEDRFFAQMELDEAEPPISEDEAFKWINGRAFTTTWPDDEFPW